MSGFGQTLTDGLMMSRKNLCTGFLYGHDQWDHYWEGSLKRDNLNIGTLKTQSVMWVGSYGLTDKINIIAMLPYVWTQASMGTLREMKGVQDLTVGVKYNFFQHELTGGTFNTFGVLSLTTPVSDYTPDFFPLSIGMHSKNISYRLTTNYQFDWGLYVNSTCAYTWRSNVTLDRPSYFTQGELHLTNEVQMPNVFDFTVNVGYKEGPIQADLNYTQQNTLGGGDIRRQDMPFVSNRMNFSKVGALIMYYLPKPKNLAVRASYNIVVEGRNVGQTQSLMAGALYTFHFSKPQ
jgi:hypothetical protein